MADLLPSIPDTSDADDGDPRVVGIDSEEADDVLAALSSNTARQLLTALHDDPGTPSDLAERVDTSLQNAQYHLGNLEDANVVRVIDTAYSEKGREMNIYGPTDQPLVVFAGNKQKETGLRTALSRLISGLGAVAAGSLLVQAVFASGLVGAPADDVAPPAAEDDEDAAPPEEEEFDDAEDVPPEEDDAVDEDAPPEEDEAVDDDAGITAEEDEEDEPEAEDEPVDDVEEDAPPDDDPDADPTAAPDDDGFAIPFVEDDGGLAVAAGLPPGALFFAGGATVLIAWFVLWYVRIHRV